MKRQTLKRYSNGTWMTETIEEKPKKKKMNSCVNPIQNFDVKKISFLSSFFSLQNIIAVFYSILLGISVAINIYQYMLIKSYIDIMMKTQ